MSLATELARPVDPLFEPKVYAEQQGRPYPIIPESPRRKPKSADQRRFEKIGEKINACIQRAAKEAS